MIKKELPVCLILYICGSTYRRISVYYFKDSLLKARIVGKGLSYDLFSYVLVYIVY